MTAVPGWYVELAADEAELDARIVAQRTPRKFCPVCGLEHREVCPSSPAVAGLLYAPMPERFDPPCEGDE